MLQCVCALFIFWMVRVTLLVHLAVSLGHCFLIEQPGSARFGDLPRWRRFVEDFVFAALLQNVSDGLL